MENPGVTEIDGKSDLDNCEQFDDEEVIKSPTTSKKQKMDNKRRKSLVRDRRSSKGPGTFLGSKTDISVLCHIIPTNIPEDKRLEMLLWQGYKAALDSAFADHSDPDEASEIKSSIKRSLEPIINESFSTERLQSAVASSKCYVPTVPENDSEREESLKKTEAYVERLRKENEEWERLKKEASATETWINNETEGLRRPKTVEESVKRLSEKLNLHRQKLAFQMKVTEKTSLMLNKLKEVAEDKLRKPTMQLNAAASDADFNVKDLLHDM